LNKEKIADDEKYMIMIYCNECKCWFHSKCIGMDEFNLEAYFNVFEPFNCLDCYIMIKNADKYLEVTYIKYLEVLKTSYTIMCFYKLTTIILRSITKDTNIKLHSKLLKNYLKENYQTLQQDKNISMFLELLRLDIFLLKEKDTGSKSKKSKARVDKVKEQREVKESLSLPAQTEPMRTENYDLDMSINIVDKDINSEKLKNVKIDQNLIRRNLYQLSLEKIKSKKLIKKNIVLFDLRRNKSTLPNAFFPKQDIIENPLDAIYFPFMSSREESEEMFNHDVMGENMLENKDGNEMQVDCEIFQNEVKKKAVTNKRVRRIRFIAEKQLKNELSNFLKKDNQIEYTSAFRDRNLLNFYDFDIDGYYDNNKERNNDIVKTALDKLNKYINLKSFPKHLKKFTLQLIIEIIILLKSSLLKWLVTQIIDNNINGSNFIQKNNLYQHWIELQDKLTNDNSILNPDNPTELNEEEINKFLEHIDPLEDSPSRNITCEFCLKKGARKISGRLLHIRNNYWGHVNCIYWSKGVYEIDDGILVNVPQILSKVKLYKCSFCRKFGATIICDFKKCGKYYHYICAQAKQCCFSANKMFSCNKCATSKDEGNFELRTRKRFLVLNNSEYVNDQKNRASVLKTIPKYQIGLFNKFGNTTVLKFIQVTRKDLSSENLDIAILKTFRKNYEEPIQFSVLFKLNENGLDLALLNFNKFKIPELEAFLTKSNLSNIFEKTEFLDDILTQNCCDKISSPVNFNLNFNRIREISDLVDQPELKEFDNNLEAFLKKWIISADQLNLIKSINK
jgi:hypothetical protein